MPLPEINTCDSLFDSTRHASTADAVEHMRLKYSFYIPDLEYLEDLEGLLTACRRGKKRSLLSHYLISARTVPPPKGPHRPHVFVLRAAVPRLPQHAGAHGRQIPLQDCLTTTTTTTPQIGDYSAPWLHEKR